MPLVRFDNAVDVAIEVLRAALPDSTPETTLVRDPSGLITVIMPESALPDEEWDRVAAELDRVLGAYSPGPQRVLLRPSDLIDPDDVLDSPFRVPVPGHDPVFLVDRLLTNQDWLRAPSASEAPLPTAAAYSIKGGVGRSTALALLAWHLAREGKRVLVVDLDLEAPGIGTMLLPNLPERGTIDWCVESLVGQADAQLLADSTMPAPLGDATPGSIRVIPAMGSATKNYVVKLGRAYLPALDRENRTSGIAERIHGLLSEAARLPEKPDAVLLDARAGLHDIGSAVVTQLGAEVFLFARNDPQTWRAYACLFEHLRFARSVHWGMPESDLRWKLKMVAAQVEPTEAARARFIDRSYAIWSALYDSEEQASSAPGSAAAFDRDDESAPHYALPIIFEQGIRNLDLMDPKNFPTWDYVSANFGEFFRGVFDRLFPGAANSDDERKA